MSILPHDDKKAKRGTRYHVLVCLASPSTSRTHLGVATVNSNRENYRPVIILKSKYNILISVAVDCPVVSILPLAYIMSILSPFHGKDGYLGGSHINLYKMNML